VCAYMRCVGIIQPPACGINSHKISLANFGLQRRGQGPPPSLLIHSYNIIIIEKLQPKEMLIGLSRLNFIPLSTPDHLNNLSPTRKSTSLKSITCNLLRGYDPQVHDALKRFRKTSQPRLVTQRLHIELHGGPGPFSVFR